MPKGIVYLVGAGPGDPGLLTLRGAGCLAKADVILYDRLASERLLELAPATAERLYVGKSASGHTLPQQEINRLLIEKAREGKFVVRLKGGDPFVFGRGGEEALALVEAGIPFEVVPGVTAGIAAPAYAGIPVTHRGLASAVVLATGHEDPTKESSDVDWGQLAAVGSIVVYMGVKNLPSIVKALLATGRAADTPCAVISNGTTPQQRTVAATLSSIEQATAAVALQPPAILLVGEVAALREKLNWFESRPLFGRSVLVTRTREQASVLSAELEALGAAAVEIPLIEVHEVEDPGELDRAVASLQQFDWVIFTSANGVDAVWSRIEAAGRDARAFGAARLCAIGSATAERLAEHGLRADWVPRQYLSAAIAEDFRARGWAKGVSILLPRADVASRELPERLRQGGAQVLEVVAYRTVPARRSAERLKEALRAGAVDVVTFASSSSVSAFVELLEGENVGALLSGVAVASIGPVTTRSVQRHGLTVAVEAGEHTIPGLVQAICEWVEKGRS